MLVIYFYYSNANGHRPLYNFFHQDENIQKIYERILILNHIRNKASHSDPQDQFTEEDYENYIKNVYSMINELATPFCED